MKAKILLAGLILFSFAARLAAAPPSRHMGIHSRFPRV